MSEVGTLRRLDDRVDGWYARRFGTGPAAYFTGAAVGVGLALSVIAAAYLFAGEPDGLPFLMYTAVLVMVGPLIAYVRQSGRALEQLRQEVDELREQLADQPRS